MADIKKNTANWEAQQQQQHGAQQAQKGAAQQQQGSALKFAATLRISTRRAAVLVARR
jgi:hypothetical protein